MSKMIQLQKFVEENGIRGACCCGKCIDAPEHPKQKQPQGHTANMVFFNVAVKEGTKAEELKSLILESVEGSFTNINLFDGKEHNYMEIGGWIGDQGLALMLMGMGTVLGLWSLLSPITMLGLKLDDPLTQQMAGMGMLSVQVPKKVF